MAERRYSIGELAELGGVSRRTIRYYVQEGLLPAPLGVGRGDHYGPEHLDHLLQVKALQEAGRSLVEIRQLLGEPARQPIDADTRAATAPVPRAAWRRLSLAPGIELHVSSEVRLPSPRLLQDLAAFCRRHFAPSLSPDEDHHA